ncbi:DUF3293 domain-containing protein [Paraburkholderia silviterrae]|uniref:DUF3293 domain-containing protein n=1 Tax=Paraburkholderia silviterrae TaxID=2528715 RepID=A0A4R5MEX4_9BURK|nr:DUF3293 domain-containing protein [Paraburkholderia silviterrae]TDG25793.1 DUF3293 domain-containing protein [Paraburkholderia silviterrae]
MFSDSNIARDTIQAYLETHYEVLGEMPATLQIGQFNPALATLHDARHVACSAFVTACNPLSRRLDPQANAARQEALAHELAALGLTCIEGVGKHPSNQWPGEASFLVLGVTLDAARALGEKHGQNAIVWCGADAVPHLILLR